MKRFYYIDTDGVKKAVPLAVINPDSIRSRAALTDATQTVTMKNAVLSYLSDDSGKTYALPNSSVVGSTNYTIATTADITTLDNKITALSQTELNSRTVIKQDTGSGTGVVMSQNAVTSALNNKLNINDNTQNVTVNTLDATSIKHAGTSMNIYSGVIELGPSNTIIRYVANPVNDTDAVNKQYVDSIFTPPEWSQVSVLQVTGNSTTATMSQDALTRLFNNTAKLSDDNQTITADNITINTLTNSGGVSFSLPGDSDGDYTLAKGEDVGDVSQLQTTATNLVGAINEVKEIKSSALPVIVQNIGANTMKVMSQKAVTDELAKKLNLNDTTQDVTVHSLTGQFVKNNNTTIHIGDGIIEFLKGDEQVRLCNIATPVNDTDAVSKQYVDSIFTPPEWSQVSVLQTTGNSTTATMSQDSITKELAKHASLNNSNQDITAKTIKVQSIIDASNTSYNTSSLVTSDVIGDLIELKTDEKSSIVAAINDLYDFQPQEINIYQNIGPSTSGVMSQKAVSDSLSGKLSINDSSQNIVAASITANAFKHGTTAMYLNNGAMELYDSSTDDNTVRVSFVDTPVSDSDAANKKYVDTVFSNIPSASAPSRSELIDAINGSLGSGPGINAVITSTAPQVVEDDTLYFVINNVEIDGIGIEAITTTELNEILV